MTPPPLPLPSPPKSHVLTQMECTREMQLPAGKPSLQKRKHNSSTHCWITKHRGNNSSPEADLSTGSRQVGINVRKSKSKIAHPWSRWTMDYHQTCLLLAFCEPLAGKWSVLTDLSLYPLYTILVICQWCRCRVQFFPTVPHNTVPAGLIPVKNHQRLEWPSVGSHRSQDHHNFCVKGI